MGVSYIYNYVLSSIQSIRRNEIYCMYMTDCVYYIGSKLGIQISKRYSDIIYNIPDEEVDNETAVERLERFGIKVVS